MKIAKFSGLLLLGLITIITFQNFDSVNQAQFVPLDRLVFDPDFYYGSNPEVQDAVGTKVSKDQLYDHFIKVGIPQGIHGNAEFDPEFYLKTYPDITRSVGVDGHERAYYHWVTKGIDEGRQSSQDFSIYEYVRRYPDAATYAKGNYRSAFRHWLNVGAVEGRDASPQKVSTAASAAAGPALGAAASASTKLPAMGSLYTKGNQVIDSATDKPIRLVSAHIKGIETTRFAPTGLYAVPWKKQVDELAASGINSIRLSFSVEAILKPPAADKRPVDVNFTFNPDLKGKSPLEIMDQIISYAATKRIRIILDCHRTRAGEGTMASGLWYEPSGFYTEANWIKAWQILATRYKNKTNVIGADVFNEPHTTASWGDGKKTDFRAAAIRVGNAIHKINPKWLIIVEGIGAKTPGISYSWWGQNLSLAGKYPVSLKVKNRVVYSPHIYPRGVLGGTTGPLWDKAYPQNLPAIWDSLFGYLYRDKIAPIWVGEMAASITEKPIAGREKKCDRSIDKDKLWLKEAFNYLNGGINKKKTLNAGELGPGWAWFAWAFDDCGTGMYLDVMFNKIDQNKVNYLKPSMAKPF